MKDLNQTVKESLTAQDHIRDATNMVKCNCGDLYPADSFGAGFIAATGRCQNCYAAEQAEQEPVMITPGGGAFPFAVVGEIEQAEQEPVCCVADLDVLQRGFILDRGYSLHDALYAAPVSAKREWVDLTDDEIYHALAEVRFVRDNLLDGCRAVIAADREKNCA